MPMVDDVLYRILVKRVLQEPMVFRDKLARGGVVRRIRKVDGVHLAAIRCEALRYTYVIERCVEFGSCVVD